MVHSTPAGARADAEPERWAGTVQIPGSPIDFFITITSTPDGWSGTISIPAQGLSDLPLRDVIRTDARLAFGAEFRGMPEANWPSWDLTIDSTGATASGTLSQAGMSFPTTMAVGAVAPSPRRPQHPVPPYVYRTIDTSIEVTPAHGGPAHTLAGTLTLPDEVEFGPGPYPAAVLITGSGGQDRDSTVAGHKPFLVIADHLARRGIASLRCDDRGIAGSTGSFTDATTIDFAADAIAQARFLAARDDIATVGLIGHSEGGIVVPIAAAERDEVRWLVLLAAPGVPGRELMQRQLAEVYRAAGDADEASIAAQIAAQAACFDAALAGDAQALRGAVRELIRAEAARSAAPPPDAEIEAAVSAQAAMLGSDWFRVFLTLDPADALRRVTQPVLVLNGRTDVQVVHDQNVPPIRDALAQAGNGAVTVHVLDGLNHLFQPSTTGAIADYGAIETTFDPGALDLISGWIIERREPPATPAP
jgi:hypothetical protein